MTSGQSSEPANPASGSPASAPPACSGDPNGSTGSPLDDAMRSRRIGYESGSRRARGRSRRPHTSMRFP